VGRVVAVEPQHPETTAGEVVGRGAADGSEAGDDDVE
jgi:hypothetical protein